MHVEFVTSNEGRRANIYYAYEKIKKQETKKNTLDFPPLFSIKYSSSVITSGSETTIKYRSDAKTCGYDLLCTYAFLLNKTEKGTRIQ